MRPISARERDFSENATTTKAIVVTNLKSDPITINKVVINGEYDAPNGKFGSDGFGFLQENYEQTFPVKLTIGESCYAVILWKSNIGPASVGYEKTAVFYDIYTTAGDFHFER